MKSILKAYIDSQPLFNIDYVTNSIYQILKAAKNIIVTANELDVEEGGTKIDFEKWLSIVQDFGKNKFLFNTKSADGMLINSIGVLGINLEDSSPYTVLEMALAVIFTHNSAVFNFENKKNNNLDNAVLTIFNQFAYSALKIKNVFERTAKSFKDFLSINYITKFYTVKANLFNSSRTYTAILDSKKGEYKNFSVNQFLTKKNC